MMPGEARRLRNAVRVRLRDAQRKFERGWLVPLTIEEHERWYGPGTMGTTGVRCTSRPYEVGDVACMVLMCKDLLDEAYGRSTKLRVGKVHRRDDRLGWATHWLHVAIMLDEACLAELRLDWGKARVRGLGEGRRPLARFLEAARAVQRRSRGAEEMVGPDALGGNGGWQTRDAFFSAFCVPQDLLVGLDSKAARVSRMPLIDTMVRQHGNCSSATVPSPTEEEAHSLMERLRANHEKLFWKP